MQADFENKGMTVPCHRFVPVFRSRAGSPEQPHAQGEGFLRGPPGVYRPIQKRLR
jgi:hypothetical protein